MSFDTDPTFNREPHGAAALAPLLWIVVAALMAVVTLIGAPLVRGCSLSGSGAILRMSD
jgi:hypothetical protein